MQHHNAQHQMKLLTYISSSNCWHVVIFAFAFAFALLMHCVARKKFARRKKRRRQWTNWAKRATLIYMLFVHAVWTEQMGIVRKKLPRKKCGRNHPFNVNPLWIQCVFVPAGGYLNMFFISFLIFVSLPMSYVLWFRMKCASKLRVMIRRKSSTNRLFSASTRHWPWLHHSILIELLPHYIGGHETRTVLIITDILCYFYIGIYPIILKFNKKHSES